MDEDYNDKKTNVKVRRVSTYHVLDFYRKQCATEDEATEKTKRYVEKCKNTKSTKWYGYPDNECESETLPELYR